MPDIYIFAVFPSGFELELSSMNSKHPLKICTYKLIYTVSCPNFWTKECMCPKDATQPLPLPLPLTLHY